MIYISDNKNTDSVNSSPAENSIFENSESVNSISENTGIINSIFENSESVNSISENTGITNSIFRNSESSNFISENVEPSSFILDNFESATVEIKILSHNVFLLPKGLPGWGNWGQNERAERIASSNYIRNQDVIVFDEAFDTNARKILLDGVRSEYPYQTDVIGRTQEDWDA
ncbi:sphingomyelinase C 2 family protein, partial [Leptospira santarosai str. HAI134]